MFNLKNKKSGFTFVELMVVITIIGILAAIVMSSFGVAKKKSRVAKRVSDIKQVQTALEFYYAANHSYPSTSGAWTACPTTSSGAGSLISGLAPLYIPVVPTDPQWSTSASTNCYIYRSDGTDYAFRDDNVTEMLAGQSAPNYMSYSELIDPARDGGSSSSVVDGATVTAWKVYSSGGVTW